MSFLNIFQNGDVNVAKSSTEKTDILNALSRVLAIIEFKMDGTILTANKNFLNTLGYSLEEIIGKHHSLFADVTYARSEEYRSFWDDLNAGIYKAAEFKRLGKGGREVWIEASYNPIVGRNGKPYKVIKFATDITDKKNRALDNDGKLSALSRSQATIEFAMDGTILDANDNFLNLMGYSISEIKGRHHSIFAEPGLAQTDSYKKFWADLRNGEFQASQYKRIGKGGKEVWIEASYNPIFNAEGKPVKVVKFASDLTPRKNENRRLADEFEQSVQSLVQILASSATEMQASAQSLAAAANQTSGQSNMVAAAAEELSLSVNEISGQVVNSGNVVESAVEKAKDAEVLVNRLVEAANKIGNVAGLISDIAGQTNLLALNATIEAARAGEAGKGFAVVASEVKELASETAKATEEIRGQVAGIQDVTGSTAEAIKAIADVINKVSEISTVISGAVEEQSAATMEVSSNITSVQSAAQETGQSSQIMLEVASELATRSEELEGKVNAFLQNVRSM